MDLSGHVAGESAEDTSVSGFSFMQSSEPEATEGEVSSFSFLNSSSVSDFSYFLILFNC